MSTLLVLAYVLAFVAVVIVVQTLASHFATKRDKSKHLNRRLSMLASGMRQTEVYSTLVREPTARFSGNAYAERLTRRFWTFSRQAGLTMSPLRLVAYIGGAALVVWLCSLVFVKGSDFTQSIANAAISGAASLVLCAVAAFTWLDSARARRMRQLEEQLPLALDVITRALRAGHPVISAVQLAGNELGDPLGSEFGLIVDETTYGCEFRDALFNFADRSASDDARFFAISVSIQSETGGNLAEILEGLAQVIRGRATLSKRVKALSSEGRMSALLLSVLPVLLIGFMMLTQPSYYSTKFNDPIFWPAVVTVGGLYLIGWFMIRRIINFKY